MGARSRQGQQRQWPLWNSRLPLHTMYMYPFQVGHLNYILWNFTTSSSRKHEVIEIQCLLLRQNKILKRSRTTGYTEVIRSWKYQRLVISPAGNLHIQLALSLDTNISRQISRIWRSIQCPRGWILITREFNSSFAWHHFEIGIWWDFTEC